MLGCLRVRHLQWIPLCGRNPRITGSWRFSSVHQLGSNTKIIVSLCRDKHLLRSYSQAESSSRVQFMSEPGRRLRRGVPVGTGKRLAKAGQRVATWLTSLLLSSALRESKARLEEAEPRP